MTMMRSMALPNYRGIPAYRMLLYVLGLVMCVGLAVPKTSPETRAAIERQERRDAADKDTERTKRAVAMACRESIEFGNRRARIDGLPSFRNNPRGDLLVEQSFTVRDARYTAQCIWRKVDGSTEYKLL